MKKLREILTGAGTIILYFGFLFLTIFGIARGFHKGTGNGVASILIPPYAWFCAVASAWKEEWPSQTTKLGMLLVMGRQQTPATQLELSEQLIFMQKWVKQLPTTKKGELKDCSEKLANIWSHYEKEVCDSLVSGKPLIGFVTDSETSQLAKVPEFKKVLTDLMQSSASDFKVVMSDVDWKNISKDDLALKMEALMEGEKQERQRRIDRIFLEL
jgi:hypothetical protein